MDGTIVRFAPLDRARPKKKSSAGSSAKSRRLSGEIRVLTADVELRARPLT